MAARWWAVDPERRHRSLEGSLVFADISGFTALSERLASLGREGAEVLTDHIDAIFSELLGGPHAGGGDLLSFGGDALVLWFEGEAHARRAVAAAAEMRATVRRIGRRGTPKGNVRLRISIGVHSGFVEALLVGESHRELLVTGPAITTLVEAEGAASAGQILVSMATAELLPKGCIGEPVGPGCLLKRAPAAAVGSGSSPPDAPADLLPVAQRDELSGGGQPPEHRILSVAFLHLQGVDELVDDPTQLTSAVDGAVAIVQRHLDDHGVTFLSSDVYDDGFKVIAVSGAPVSRGDDEERLLRAVGAILGDPVISLPVRAGAHRGTAFVGAVGAPHRATYTVMGDTVNTAARVMSRAEPGQLLATPEILDRSATTFLLTPIEPFTAKGKSKPLEASIVGPPAGVRARELARLPLAGRDVERNKLLAAWDAAAAGRGGRVEIVGGGGIGKSRLIADVIAAARDSGATVLQVQAEPYQQSTPHFVTGLLLRRLGDDDVLVPPGIEGAAVTEGLADRLSAALARQRHLVVVEDGQYIDEPSLEVLGAVDISHGPHLIVVPRRPEGAPLPMSTVIELGPVPDDAIGSIVAAARGSRGILPDRLQSITALAGGNPLHAIELARAADENDLPDSIEAAIASRIDHLPPARRTRLRELSVLGTRFDLAIASDFLDGASHLDDLDEHIARTATAGRFRYSMERDVAYAGLPFRRRRALHRRAADLIASRADDPDDVAEALSHHYYEAGEASSTLRFARRAAQRAEARQSLPATAVHYERALAAARKLDVTDAERGELLLGYLIGSRYAGRSEDALAAEKELRRLHLDPMTELKISMFLSELAYDRGQFSVARRMAWRGINRSASSADDREIAGSRLVCYMQVALSSQELGDSRQARRAGREATRLAEQLGDESSQARALAIRGAAESTPLEAARLFDAAADIYGRLDNRFATAIVLNNGANRLCRVGHDDEALSRYERAADLLIGDGEDVFGAIVRSNVVPILVDRGDWSEGYRIARDVLPVVEAAGFTTAVIATMANVAKVSAAMGETVNARAELARMMPMLREGQGEPADRVISAEAMLLAGQPEEAASVIDSVDEVALAEHLVGSLRLRLVKLWAGIQRGDDVPVPSLEELALDASEAGVAYVAAAAWAGLGRLDDAFGRMRSGRISRVAVPPRRPGDPIEVIEAEAVTPA